MSTVLLRLVKSPSSMGSNTRKVLHKLETFASIRKHSKLCWINCLTFPVFPVTLIPKAFGGKIPCFQSYSGISYLSTEPWGPHLSPTTGRLAIRAPCPHQECGLADKHGVNNQYHIEGRVVFLCPNHGEYCIDLDSPTGIECLEFNTPLRNLIRTKIAGNDIGRSWILCTGSDYAGFYQEQFTWRLLSCPKEAPIIFYAPQILDWSGAKLSKSLYVKQDAYKYLCESERQYLLNVELLLQFRCGLEALYKEVHEWVEKPFMLFRNYTIAYLDNQLAARGMGLRKLTSS